MRTVKFKIGAILGVIFLALSFGAALFQDRLQEKENSLGSPNIKDIVSATINIGGPPDPNKEPIQMDLNDNLQKMTVAKILYWLSHSEYVGSARNQFLSLGGGPSEFVLNTKNGKSIEIVDASNPITIAISNGWMTTGVSVDDQVTISYDHKTMRFRSPDLKQWIENDMSQIIAKARK